MPQRASYHVVLERWGGRMEYWDRFVTEEEAEAECVREVNQDYARAVHLYRSGRGGLRSPGELWVKSWEGPGSEDVVTRFRRLQGMEEVLPPESGADELGEEEF